MSAILLPHPSTPARAVERLTVEILTSAGHDLRLVYRLLGDPQAILWPPPQARQRTEGLWRHTCFEAFLQAPTGEYWEYNLAPSGAWAAYEFTGYRAGMKPLAQQTAPQIRCEADADSFELAASLDLRWLAGRHSPVALRLGLSAVIEDRTRVLSYFALKHPAEKPDFHLADSFVASLAPVKEHA
jgi:hypothetical protein